MTYNEMKMSISKSINKWDYGVVVFVYTFLAGIGIIDDVVIKAIKERGEDYGTTV